MFVQMALLAAQLWLGEVTRQRPKRTSFDEFQKDNQPSELRAIPYIGGTVQITPPRMWYGDFEQRAVERDSHWTDYIWAGALAGLLDFITVAYRSYVGEMFPLCWGPDANVEQIFINDRLMFQAIVGSDNAGGGFLIDDPQAWGGDQPPGEGGEYAFCKLTRGNYTDPTDSYIESLLSVPPNKTPSLRGISTLWKYGPSGFEESGYFHAGGVGVIPKFKEWKVTVRRQPDNLATGFNKIGRHMNPIETIYEWSTSLEYGARIPVEELNLDNWRQIAEDLHAEGNGWSGKIEDATSPQAVVQDVLDQIDAIADPSPSLGMTIKLIRRDYSFGSLRVMDQSSVTRVERFTTGTYEDTKNKVNVEFSDQDNNFKGKKALYIDIANQIIQGGRTVPQSQTLLGVADFDQANTIATADGRALGLPRASLDCFVKPSFGRLTTRGEVLIFEWSSPSFEIVMRVMAMTPNGPEQEDYHLLLVEDQFATGLRTFGETVGTAHEDPGAGLDTPPPSATIDSLTLDLVLTNTNQFVPTIIGQVSFGAYPGGQLGRIYVTEPGGVQTLSPIRIAPDANGEAQFAWPANAVGEYEFCVQTFSWRGATNGVKVCDTIDIANIGSPSLSPSSSVSPSPSPSISPSASESPSVSPSLSPSGSLSPSASGSQSPSPSGSQSPSLSPSSSISPSPSLSPSSSASPSGAEPINPSDQTDIWEWWEPSREAYANGAEIATLTGQANGRDMTGFAATFTPIMQTNVLNGLAVASCPTGFKSWLGPDMSALTAAHLFAVVKVDTDPADNGMWRMGTGGGGGGNDSRYPLGDGVIAEAAFSTVRYTVGNPAVPLTSWRVYEISSITNEWICRIDGTQLGSTETTNTVSGNSSPRVGCTNTQSMKGHIAGIYLFSAKLSSPNRAGHIAYINDRFGLSAS